MVRMPVRTGRGVLWNMNTSGGWKIKKAFPHGKAFGMNDSGNQFPVVSLFCKSCKGAEYASVSLFGATSQDGFLTA